jgi:class 3 adenylate cyclase
MALHAGEVRYDEHGVTAAAVNLAFRLRDADALKAALASSRVYWRSWPRPGFT